MCSQNDDAPASCFDHRLNSGSYAQTGAGLVQVFFDSS